MPVFRYEVSDRHGKTLRGVMSAPSEMEVRRRLSEQGYSVSSITAASGGSTRVAAPTGPRRRTGAPKNEVAVFFRQLASLLHAGMTPFQALMQISGETRNRGMREAALALAEKAQAGVPLSDTMAEYPRIFPEHIVGVVRAGEVGGFLPLILGDIALDYELAQRASSRVMRVISWTLWANVIGLILFAPFIRMVFAGAEIDLGAIVTRFAAFTFKWTLPPLVLLVGGYHIAGALLRQPRMRPLASRLVLKVPWAGRASRERSLATFSRILWRLQKAGILPIKAWQTASRVPENAEVADRLAAQTGRVASGVKLSEALSATGVFSYDDIRVLSTAEASGQTADSLERIAAYYQDAAQTSAGRARWLGLRVAILASLFATGAILINFALYYHDMFTWVDRYFGVD